MSQLVVSIIMPLYNAEQFLGDAIDSIIGQSYSQFELLICDDASTDRSIELLQQYNDKRIKVFKSPVNRGYLETCNYLFSKATGDLITWQDADDVSHPDRLRRQVDFLERNPEIVMCGTGAWYFKEHYDRPVRHKEIATGYNNILTGFSSGNQFCGASVMMRASLLDEFKGYNPFFNRIGNEDYDFFYRVAQRYPVDNLGDILYYVRLSPGSVSRTIRNAKQLISDKIVEYLAEQRRANNGLDSLTGLNPELLEEAVHNMLMPYVEDSTLVHRKEADKHAYNKMHKEAFISSLKAFFKNPFILMNCKYLVSCFLRYLINR